MPIRNVNDDILHSDAAKEYFFQANSNTRQGFRYVLETLDLPVPDYAKRKPVGRPRNDGQEIARCGAPSQAVLSAFRADNPQEPRPTKAKPLDHATEKRRVQAAVSKAKAKGSLFDETFGNKP
jgi:hypothetical protein